MRQTSTRCSICDIRERVAQSHRACARTMTSALLVRVKAPPKPALWRDILHAAQTHAEAHSKICSTGT